MALRSFPEHPESQIQVLNVATWGEDLRVSVTKAVTGRTLIRELKVVFTAKKAE